MPIVRTFALGALLLASACGGELVSDTQEAALAKCVADHGGSLVGCGSGSGSAGSGSDAGVDAGSGSGSGSGSDAGVDDANVVAADAVVIDDDGGGGSGSGGSGSGSGSDAGGGSGSGSGGSDAGVADDAGGGSGSGDPDAGGGSGSGDPDAGDGSGGEDAGEDAGDGDAEDAEPDGEPDAEVDADPDADPDAGSGGGGSDASGSDAGSDGGTECVGTDPEDCNNVLQVFEETSSADRPTPSCTDVANWLTADEWDPGALSLYDYSLESPQTDGVSIDPSMIHDLLWDGTLIGFNLVRFEDEQTVCSFVSTWDAPLKSRWVVESPPLTPTANGDADDVCDNGWSGDPAGCQLDELNRLYDAGDPPQRDTSDTPPDPEFVITVDP